MTIKDKEAKEKREKPLEQRFSEAAAIVKHFREDYFNENTGEAWCKLCGASLRILRDVKMPDGITRQIAVETASYTEITLRMDDKTAHETLLCKKCAYNITDDQAELCYLIDVKQWDKEADKMGKERQEAKAAIAELGKRVPIQALPYSRTDQLNRGGR